MQDNDTQAANELNPEDGRRQTIRTDAPLTLELPVLAGRAWSVRVGPDPLLDTETASRAVRLHVAPVPGGLVLPDNAAEAAREMLIYFDSNPRVLRFLLVIGEFDRRRSEAPEILDEGPKGWGAMFGVTPQTIQKWRRKLEDSGLIETIELDEIRHMGLLPRGALLIEDYHLRVRQLNAALAVPVRLD